jgi:hypothetical protein
LDNPGPHSAVIEEGDIALCRMLRSDASAIDTEIARDYNYLPKKHEVDQHPKSPAVNSFVMGPS